MKSHCRHAIQKCILLFISLLGTLPLHTVAAETRFIVSVDVPPHHITSISIDTFLERLTIATQGEVKGKLFHSGQLYAARDEPKAVARGDIQMSVSLNTWLSAFSPSYAIFDLPLFTGRSLGQINALVDGALGRELAGHLESRLDIVVPGRPLLLGFANSFGATRKITSFEDFDGMRIRVPGGAGFVMRYKALGAVAVSMPFPDVPLALSQRTVDGLLTTHETVSSTKLYEAGVKSTFIDQVSVIYTTPLVNKAFWESLSSEHRKTFRDVWDSVVDEARVEAEQQQALARAKNAKQGVAIYEPTAQELQTVNARLMALVPTMAERLNIDPTIVELASLPLAEPN